MLKKYLQWLIVVGAVANIWIYWDTPAVAGWVVAILGWLPHALKKEG